MVECAVRFDGVEGKRELLGDIADEGELLDERITQGSIGDGHGEAAEVFAVGVGRVGAY